VVIVYFSYVAAIAPFFIRSPWRATLLAAGIAGALVLGAKCGPVVRAFLPLGATFAAYREMDWFTPAVRDYHLERVWIVWDRLVLDHYGLRAAVESAGRIFPEFLELCYVLVYGVAPVALWALYANARGKSVNQFWAAYLAGTLGAYAMFPYFPSEPPRTAFPGEDMPQVQTAVRAVNMAITGGYGIHSSVFPSAHVSSAFSAAWALLAILPNQRWIGWGFVVYGFFVALATLYGRYHFGVDAVAGLAISLLAIVALHLNRPRYDAL
jgi:membrane-associated phospholipid phosphatase